MSSLKTFHVRYNTHSTDDTNRWRLIENGNEQFVSNVIIDGYTFTSKDWMPEINENKYHISCQGYCKIKDNVAYVTATKEKSALIRHILKTISYRFLGTLVTITTAYFLGVSIEISALLGIGELLIKPLLYFLHERIWYKKIRIKEWLDKIPPMNADLM
jgi:uncharacterized membrane protein